MKNSMNLKITIVTLFLIFLIAIFYIYTHVEIIRLGYKIEDLKKKKDELEKEIKRLEIVKTNLLNLENVEKIAKEKLGMVPVDSSNIFIWDFKIDSKYLNKND
ncbi:MAG: cell division protein FtsL [Acidobacteriota bacterium]